MARHPQSDQEAVRTSEVLPGPSSSLGKTLQHVRLLQRVQRILSVSLEPSLRDQFQVANIRQNRLILLAPSSAWATRLRMESANLIHAMREAGFAELCSVEVRVAPRVEQPASVRTGKSLSLAAEQALGSMARLGAESED